jgi:hypothetical protein
MNPSATLVCEAREVDRWLDADGWYTLVFETAELLRQGLAMNEYESLHYAARWLRGYGQANG